jgi:biopolymer transport protein ExbB
MWFVLSILALAQADDILADEAKAQGKQPPAATAKAQAAPVPAATAPAPAGEPAKAPADGKQPAEGGKTEAAEGKAGEEAKTDAAAEPPKPAEPSAAGKFLSDLMKTGALGYMIKGGIFMWPILALGIIALGVMIERYRALMMIASKDDALRGEIRRLLQEDQIEAALELCERRTGPVPAILGAGLRKYLIARRLGYDAAKIEEQVVKGMEEYSVHVVAALEKHLPILATVSSAAPMIGFLGTVQGMIEAFQQIVSQHGKQDIVLSAAAGIEVALLTTLLGLIVGIPAYVGFNYFTSAVNRFILEVEESSAELIEGVTLQLALAAKANEPEHAEASR